MSRQRRAPGEPLLSWSDVVFTTRDRGDERVILGAADLVVHPGERVCISCTDSETRRVLIDLLVGAARPLYGRISATGARVLGDSDLRTATIVLGCAQNRATVTVTDDATAIADATRVLEVHGGGLRAASRPRRWSIDDVRAAVFDRLTAADAPVEAAKLVADVLVDADVRGHHSHGVELLPMYLDRVAHGGINVNATPTWVTQSSVVHVLSGNGGFGQLAAREAAVTCARAASDHGLAAVAIRANNHVGMLAAYRRPFLEKGIIGLILNISGPSVAAPSARRAALGNNAVCLIAPGADGEAAVIADFATGVVASGKIRDLVATGGRVPDGWLLGSDGQVSSDPRDLDRGGSVPVFGGIASGYKGLCVAVITEVLAGMLAGQTISPQVNKQRQQPDVAMGCSQLMVGFSPVAFQAGDLAQLTSALRDAVANSYGAAGPPLVFFPEQQEQLRARESAELGIRVPHDVAVKLGLTFA